MAVPLPAISLIMILNALCATGSRPFIGSSNSRISGSPMRAAPRERRCLIPWLKLESLSRERDKSPTL